MPLSLPAGKKNEAVLRLIARIVLIVFEGLGAENSQGISDDRQRRHCYLGGIIITANLHSHNGPAESICQRLQDRWLLGSKSLPSRRQS